MSRFQEVPLETGGKDELYKMSLSKKKYFSQGRFKEIEPIYKGVWMGW